MQIRLFSVIIFFLALLGPEEIEAQCDLSCPTEMDVFLPADGSIELSLTDLLGVIPDGCPVADSISVVPGQLDCSFAGSATPYELRHSGTGAVLCAGVLYVQDTTPQRLICREQVAVYLPEHRSYRTMVQADYVFAVQDNCDRGGSFDFWPGTVDCSMVDVGVTYVVTAPETNDTLCTGTVTVLDTTSTVIQCKAQVDVTLNAVTSTFLLPGDVILEGADDNCQRLSDLDLSPVFYNCNMAGENTYHLTDRASGDTICTGVVLVTDPVLPTVTCVDTFTLFLPVDGTPQQVSPTSLVTTFSDNCGTVEQLQLFPAAAFDCAAVDSAITYELLPMGTDEVVCTGVIEVVDTFSRVVNCEEQIMVSLPLTYEGFELTPDIFVKDSIFPCRGAGALEVFPATVYCYDAGAAIPYTLTHRFSGDTLCSGILRVEGSDSTAITCRDTLEVSLPESGQPYRLDWYHVVGTFSDNCISIQDLEVSPSMLSCADAGQSVTYTVSSRSSEDVLCQGIVEVTDDTPLRLICKETVTVRISDSGFPAMLFPSQVIDQLNDNCSSVSDFRTTPVFFFCPDSSATYTLIDRRTEEVACTGRVIVTGNPSAFGNCATLSGVESERGGLEFELKPSALHSLRLFPNPTKTDEIRVQLPEVLQGRVDYQIVNLLGAVQRNGQLDQQGGVHSLALSGLPAGTYILVLRSSDGQRISRRFVKNR